MRVRFELCHSCSFRDVISEITNSELDVLIEEIVLKIGAIGGQSPLNINSPQFTVFVGPNNSGKSQLLRDIHNWCLAGAARNPIILGSIKFKHHTQNEVQEFFAKHKVPANPNEHLNPGFEFFSISGQRFQANAAQLKDALQNPNGNPTRSQHFGNYYAKFYTLNLDGASRMTLLNEQQRGDLKAPTGIFARLFCDDSARKKVRKIVHDALGLYFGVDHSEGDKLQIRFGDTEPPNERTLEEDILCWMKQAKPIQQVSDGVKAFTGMIVQLFVGSPKVLLIDEPEAFLHPSLSFILGKEIAKSSKDEKKQVFIATHSPQFLMGAIQSGIPVNVVRLTYSGGVGAAQLLSTERVYQLLRDPLLRSANVMSGLFHEHVIVSEADADRSFYQEINERMIDSVKNKGVPNALYLNANGKDTLHRIAKPLRSMGVPVAAIADIDVLSEGGSKWTDHLTAYGIPQVQHQPLGALRKSVWDALNATGKNPKTEGGIELLNGESHEAAHNLLSQLREYGFFIVPRGEVENWLSDLNVPRSKPGWLKNIFERMGQDPNDPNYVVPTMDDVWGFSKSIGDWLLNPNRKGMSN